MRAPLIFHPGPKITGPPITVRGIIKYNDPNPSVGESNFNKDKYVFILG